MYKKRYIALLLAICMLVGLPQMAEKVFATSATEKRDEAEKDLNDVSSEMDNLKDDQAKIEAELAKTRKELAKLMTEQDKLAGEIADTQGAIEETEKELVQAELDEKEQYEAMKLRIQYMYENSTQDSFLEAVIGARGLADLLKRVEYVAAVHKADRELTEQYQQTVEMVAEKKETLVGQMETLLAKEKDYLEQQTKVENMIAKLENEQDEYAQQLASAQERAIMYQQIIAEQEEIIRLEEEQRRKEEEEKNNQNNNKPAVPVTDSELVNYALQFVGNPYVWGGNSLTNGCDCSGFVHLIYKHFGYTVPRYSMSFLYVGEAVTLDEIQPGDIVVYARKAGIGHVAIYIGNGKIVEAQSSAAGITCDRDVDCREIVGIRRVLK